MACCSRTGPAARCVANPLRLDYMGLKKRLGGVPSRRRKAPRPAFVELVAPHPAALEDCIIEFETTESLWIVTENGSL